MTDDDKRMWPIIVVSPPTPAHLVDLPDLGRCIISAYNIIYPLEELRKVAHLFGKHKLPLFLNHKSMTNLPGPLTRLLNGPYDKVGQFTNSYWDEERTAIMGIFQATEPWDERFTDELENGLLGERSFSIVWDIDFVRIQIDRHYPRREVVHEIAGVKTCDLVSYPALGGRFALPGCEPSQELQEILHRELYKDMPEIFGYKLDDFGDRF